MKKVFRRDAMPRLATIGSQRVAWIVLLVPVFVATLAVVLLSTLGPTRMVDARPAGITGYSGNPSTNRGAICMQCHSGGTVPDVTLDGPTSVFVDATNTYTLTITGGQRSAGGLDVSVTGGTLDTPPGAQDIQVLGREITHTEPKRSERGSGVVFTFLWTAPSTPGRAKMFGAGNSVNLNRTPLGDAAEADVLSISVEQAPPTPTPAPTVESPYPVFAEELANPHGLSALDDGSVLVGEGGTAGESAKPGEFSPGAGDGRIVLIDVNVPDSATVLLDQMTNSVDPGGGIVGGNHAIAVQGGGPEGPAATSYLVAQGGGPAHLRPDEAAKILKVTADGEVSVLADTLAYEREHNPDGAAGEAGVDSNPWRVVMGPDARAYVVDAGANDIVALDLATSELSTWAVFTELSEGQSAVPTGLAFADSNSRVAYASLLGPFGPGTTEIRRLEDLNNDGDVLDEGEQSLLLGGLRLVTDIAMGPGGLLFFLQLDGGTLSRIDPGCWTEDKPCNASDSVVVADRLPAASGLTFLSDGSALIATTNRPNPAGLSLNTNLIVRIPAAQLLPEPSPTSTATESRTPEHTPTPTVATETPTPTETPRPGPDSGTLFIPFAARSALNR